jgi:hypothetical protein
MLRMDRSHYPVRRQRLADEGLPPRDHSRTPGELVAMVWELTRQAWTFKDGRFDEPRLRRDVGRVIRGRR